MKQKMRRDLAGMTIIELVVVIVVIGVLVAFCIPSLLKRTSAAQRISCLNNFLEIGTGYRLWAGDNGDRNPAEQTVAKGGWGDFLTNGDQGAICWTNYAIMSNELGRSTRILVCPVDERKAATSFGSDFNDNAHLSYFVGVSANDTYPQSIQGGDRNLGVGSVPDTDYGFSPKSGKGNDVAIAISGPVSWSWKIHSAGNAAGAGFILLGDGSVQRTTTASFRTNWLNHAAPTTNWPIGHVPATPSVRLVFP